MKLIYLFVFIGVFVQQANSQNVRIKRKFCKKYEGVSPSFQAIIGKDILDIPSAKMEIQLKKDSIYVLIGSMKYAGVYSVEKAKNLNELNITFERENSHIPERLVLNTKKKTLIRKGVFPEPDIPLIRVKKEAKS